MPKVNGGAVFFGVPGVGIIKVFRRGIDHVHVELVKPEQEESPGEKRKGKGWSEARIKLAIYIAFVAGFSFAVVTWAGLSIADLSFLRQLVSWLPFW